MYPLKRWFPNSIQSKGLLATEGVVSIPIHGSEGAGLQSPGRWRLGIAKSFL